MIAHIAPGSMHREETRNTLLYGQRARAISNRIRKFVYQPNHSGDTASVIQELRTEVRRLQKKLSERAQNNNNSVGFGGIMNPPVLAAGNGQHENRNTTPIPFHASPQDVYLVKQERPELGDLKNQISSLFDQEFRLRNQLLKLDGAMLQSALDCEVLRLMVMDWETVNIHHDSEFEGSSIFLIRKWTRAAVHLSKFIS